MKHVFHVSDFYFASLLDWVDLMASLRIKITLNKGRQGISVEKLADIAKEAEKFLESFSKDMQLGDAEWIAEKFRNGSVSFDIVYIGEAPDTAIQKSGKILKQMADPKPTVGNLTGVTKDTFLQFAKIAFPIEGDDAIGIGVYNGSKRPKTYTLSKQRAIEIEKEILQRAEQYGSVQGSITALFKGGQSTLWITERLTSKRIVCFYPPQYYKKIVSLLEDRDSLVNAEGWMTIINGEIKELRIKTLELLAVYHDGDIEKLFGADPDFTGGLTTGEYIDHIRDEVS